VPGRSRAAGKTAAASDNGDNGAASSSNAAAANGNGHGTRLVIVESPAKARTIAGYLGHGYVVESSIGHIRDMPDKAAEIPQKYRAEPWARLGVDVDNDFQALYVVPSDKKQQVSKLKTLLKDADELYLATDEDREGEAIAWHLTEELKPKVPTKRMVFHEITPEAIARAIANPTELNSGKVDAYQTRRVLDRLYGYEVSPVLWKKVMPRLSAGRVQSVATRLIVDKERDRIAFRSASYWDLEAEFATRNHGAERLPDDPTTFTATLQVVDGKRVAQGRDFTSVGELRGGEGDAAQVLHLDGGAAAALAARLRGEGTTFRVSSVERKPYRRSPYAPFRTTTLQQEASRKLGFTTKYTMSVAQRLYENGYITYMRTDSITLSQTAIDAARQQARELYGAEYVPDAPRTYTSKVKNAQEAHEAIRPAGDRFRTPGEAQRSGLKGDELRLYDLIWKRTVSCQMKDATGESVSVKVEGTPAAATASAARPAAAGAFDAAAVRTTEFGASGKIITFYGFLKAYVESTDEASQDRDDQERRLPVLAEDDPLRALRLAEAEHATRPPARYTEASLIKELEDREIGRPSTYATIIGTILDRGYVFKKGTALVPSFLAFAVVNLLVRHFGQLVDYAFTAQMEDALDEIAKGEAERVPWLRRFYFGDEEQGNGSGKTVSRTRSEDSAGLGLKALVSDITDIDARDVSSFPLAGTDIVVRVGRYGPYLERDGQRANVPEDMAPDELTPEKAEELLSEPSGDKPLGSDPVSGHQVVAKAGRFGPYVTEVLPEGAKDKPRTASLLKSMTLDTVTLDDALKLLSLPRTLGEIDGEPVTVQNGRYGPYVKQGAESRSLATEEDMFTVTLEAAKALLAEPKARGRGRAGSAPPLRELGDDPATGKPMVIKDGRFGPYVTDGETNASLRKGDEVASITPARGAELLADRRAAAPAPRARKATPAKSTTAKKASTAKTGTAAKKPAGAAAKPASAKKAPRVRKSTET
jgi:DNA topoisomerase-1